MLEEKAPAQAVEDSEAETAVQAPKAMKTAPNAAKAAAVAEPQSQSSAGPL